MPGGLARGVDGRTSGAPSGPLVRDPCREGDGNRRMPGMTQTRTARPLLLPLLLAALLAIGACDPAGKPGTDTDDGTAPSAFDENVLLGTVSGGAAEVKDIVGLDRSGVATDSLVYAGELDMDCSADWRPQGTLCDEEPTTDSRTTSTKTNTNSGATWLARDGNAELTTGVIVVDACSDGSCSAIRFDEVVVFQMFSDGKATAFQLFTHPEEGSTPPEWDDPGWAAVTGVEALGEGTDTTQGAVEDPTVLQPGLQTARYLRLDAQNDGTYGSETYTEIRSVKVFGAFVP